MKGLKKMGVDIERYAKNSNVAQLREVDWHYVLVAAAF